MHHYTQRQFIIIFFTEGRFSVPVDIHLYLYTSKLPLAYAARNSLKTIYKFVFEY